MHAAVQGCTHTASATLCFMAVAKIKQPVRFKGHFPSQTRLMQIYMAAPQPPCGHVQHMQLIQGVAFTGLNLGCEVVT